MQVNLFVVLKHNIIVESYHSSNQISLDVDECQSLPCAFSPLYSCKNNIGSYTCTCKKGYAFDGMNCTGMYFEYILESDMMTSSSAI